MYHNSFCIKNQIPPNISLIFFTIAPFTVLPVQRLTNVLLFFSVRDIITGIGLSNFRTINVILYHSLINLLR